MPRPGAQTAHGSSCPESVLQRPGRPCRTSPSAPAAAATSATTTATARATPAIPAAPAISAARPRSSTPLVGGLAGRALAPGPLLAVQVGGRFRAALTEVGLVP